MRCRLRRRTTAASPRSGTQQRRFQRRVQARVRHAHRVQSASARAEAANQHSRAARATSTCLSPDRPQRSRAKRPATAKPAPRPKSRGRTHRAPTVVKARRSSTAGASAAKPSQQPPAPRVVAHMRPRPRVAGEPVVRRRAGGGVLITQSAAAAFAARAALAGRAPRTDGRTRAQQQQQPSSERPQSRGARLRPSTAAAAASSGDDDGAGARLRTAVREEAMRQERERVRQATEARQRRAQRARCVVSKWIPPPPSPAEAVPALTPRGAISDACTPAGPAGRAKRRRGRRNDAQRKRTRLASALCAPCGRSRRRRQGRRSALGRRGARASGRHRRRAPASAGEAGSKHTSRRGTHTASPCDTHAQLCARPASAGRGACRGNERRHPAALPVSERQCVARRPWAAPPRGPRCCGAGGDTPAVAGVPPGHVPHVDMWKSCVVNCPFYKSPHKFARALGDLLSSLSLPPEAARATHGPPFS